GKHAEDAARVHEADTRPELAGGAPETIDEAAERLRGGDGIQDDTLQARETDDRLKLLLTNTGPPDPLESVQPLHLVRHLHEDAVLTARGLDHLGDVLADARRRPRHRHAHDLRAQACELARHEQTGLAAAAEGRDHDGVEGRGAVADLLGDLLAAPQVAECAG